MTEEERAFKREFSEWEKKYDDWREQNKNHPDRVSGRRKCCTLKTFLSMRFFLEKFVLFASISP
jgi:hypothetical protein